MKVDSYNYDLFHAVRCFSRFSKWLLLGNACPPLTGCCKTWTLDSGLDWTGLDWTGLDRDFDDHFLLTCNS